jgi:hypothetical protein
VHEHLHDRTVIIRASHQRRFKETNMPRGLEPKSFQENRTEARTPCTRTIDVLPCQARRDWKFITAEITDCSLHGLGLISTEPIEVNQQFLVKLKLQKGVRMLLYTVHNCALWERTRYRIGAKFSGFAAQEFDEDLKDVLESLVKGT